MIDRAQQGPLNTDLPPDQLGNGALFIQNMIAGSASSMRPRPGTTTFQSIAPNSLISDQRTVYCGAISGDTSYTTFIYCMIRTGGVSPTVIVEAVFPVHMGKATYDTLSGSVNLDAIKTLTYAAAGTYPPTCVQYGNKAFLYYPDQRPIMIMGNDTDSSPIAIDCGIQPPIGPPGFVASSTNANNLVYSDTQASLNQIQFCYAYYSTARNVYSQPSPLAYYTIPASPDPPKKVIVTGFFQSRDSISDNLIDTIVVGARSGTNSGLMVLWPDMATSIDPVSLTGTVSVTNGSANLTGSGTVFLTEVKVGYFLIVNPGTFQQVFLVRTVTDDTHIVAWNLATSTISTAFMRAPVIEFDLSPAQLQLGFDISALAGSLYVPPSVKYCERYGEEIWTGGQREQITFSGAPTITVTKSVLGTADVTESSADVLGHGTSFTTQLRPLDNISINGNPLSGGTYLSAGTATDNTHLILTTAAGITATGVPIARLWRQFQWARVTASTAIWGPQHLYFSLYVNGVFVGQIADIDSNGTDAYIANDVVEDISSTSHFFLAGANDRLWRTAYDANTPGNTPTVFPECAQINYPQLLTQSLDQGQKLMGLKATEDELRIFFDNSVARMTGGNEVGEPLPDIRQYYGRAGTCSPRSIARAPTGETAWIGTEGIYIDTDNGASNAALNLGCQYLFRGLPWIARADLPNIAMSYSRAYNGFVFGPFTIAGVSGWWGLISYLPQPGIYLFDNQTITSNITEYINGNGEGVVLAGDSQGRIKHLLDDTVLTDVAAVRTDPAAAYICLWQSGFDSRQDGASWAPSRVKLPGLIPQAATFDMTLRLWRSLYAMRDRTRMLALDANSEYTVAITQPDTALDKWIPVNPNRTRFQSLGYQFSSTSGSYTSGTARPMEMNHYLWAEASE